jgi:hypothetical protein
VKATDGNQPVTLKDAAIAYARAGHAVFPLRPGTKEPYGGTHGNLDATTDVEKIRRHWDKRPDSNIGLRPAPDQYANDVDTAESHRSGLDGYATLAELIKTVGPLPPDAPITETASGGLHIWLSYDGGELAGILGPGIQIKGHGGYLVVPPSIIGGKPYRWRVPLNGSPPRADKWTDAARPTKPAPRQPKRPAGNTFDGDSIIAAYNAEHSWTDVLTGWTCADTNPDADGAVWLHPTHTSKCSATISGGRLYVYTPNTPFDQTTAGDPHGYDRFDAYALLNHNGNASAAAKALRKLKNGNTSRVAGDYDYSSGATDLADNKPGENTYTDSGNAVELVGVCTDRKEYVPKTAKWVRWDSVTWHKESDDGATEYEARKLADEFPIPSIPQALIDAVDAANEAAE